VNNVDFTTLPPEVTSALIHSGPGAGSLIAASAAWHQLGAELEDSARGYASVLSSLTDAWHGSSSAAMLTAVEPYIAWLDLAAQQCQLIGSSVQTVVAAFELTHFTVVHPALVAANRTRLAQLLATNFFGVNLPAIAETEAEYQAMWVNNSAAMYRYAATSASAVVPPQFSPPPPIANPTGPTIPAGVVSAASDTVVPVASSTPAATAPVPGATAAASPLSTFLSSLSSASGALVNNGWFILGNTYANQAIAGGIPINLLSYLAQLAAAQAVAGSVSEVARGLGEGEAAIGPAGAGLADALQTFGSGRTPTAGVGVGVLVGRLTMPPAVVGMLPASQPPVQLLSAASPLVPGESGVPPMLPPLMPASRTPPRASSGGRRREGRDYENIEYGSEIPGTVMHRPPSAG
jgi:PPE-repeat protein